MPDCAVLARCGGFRRIAISPFAPGGDGDKMRRVCEMLAQTFQDQRMNTEQSHSDTPISEALIESRFRELAKQWKKETLHLSSAARMAKHPAYQEIIGMGQQVVPLMLAELKRRPDFWFAALRAITGENPVSPDSAGKIAEMARAWIVWGESKGYIE